MPYDKLCQHFPDTKATKNSSINVPLQINPLYTGRLFLCYMLDKSTVILGVSGTFVAFIVMPVIAMV